MHEMATKLGFAYQPFYRLMNKKTPPTLYSLYNIAQNLKCSIAELVDNKTIFFDVNCYQDFEFYFEKKQPNNKIRIYLPLEILDDVEYGELFTIKSEIAENKIINLINGLKYHLDLNTYQLFVSTKKIFLDGIFLIFYDNRLQLVNVINASSTIITINYENSIRELKVQDILVYAKFISFVNISNNNLLKGIQL